MTIYRIEILSYEWPTLEIEVDCGSGTYIRSIARDLGESLGCGGLIEVLTRTRIGPFSMVDAIDPETLSRETIPGRLRPAIEAVAGMPSISLSEEELGRILKGQAIVRNDVAPGEVALLGADGDLVAIAEAGAGQVAPRRVLASG